MNPPDPLGGRLPIGESPRWITVHAFIGIGCAAGVILIYQFASENWYDWLDGAQTLGAVLTLVSLARLYAARRTAMGKVATGYLRTALFFISIAGATGTWHLSISAGVAFYIWTIVERRR